MQNMQLVFITQLPILVWEEKAVLQLLNWNLNLIWNGLGLEMKLFLLPLVFLPTSLYLNGAHSLFLCLFLRRAEGCPPPVEGEMGQSRTFPHWTYADAPVLVANTDEALLEGATGVSAWKPMMKRKQ